MTSVRGVITRSKIKDNPQLMLGDKLLFESIKEELLKLKNQAVIDQAIWQQFWDRLHNNEGLIRADNMPDHFSTFFLPLSMNHKLLYLGHHIKAQAWIPPGGHIEPGETPQETVRREFPEELDYTLDAEETRFFDITITRIERPKSPCKTHWDLWYLVKFNNSPEFKFDKREGYQAGWFDKEKALELVRIVHCRRVVERVIGEFNL